MALDVALTDDAARDLDEVYAHIHTRGSWPEADRFLGRLEQEFAAVAARPDVFPPAKELAQVGGHDYREAVFDNFRFVFRVLAGRVCIMLITDSRRDLQALLERRLLEA